METKVRIAVVAAEQTDLETTMRLSGLDVTRIAPQEAAKADWGLYQAICLLGATHEEPYIPDPRARAGLERAMAGGARVFAEYTGSIAHYYQSGPAETTRYDRLVYVGADREGLRDGDLLEDQCNVNLRMQNAMYSGGTPILEYTGTGAHDRLSAEDRKPEPPARWGMWLDRSGTLMIAACRMCNWIQARFSPSARWKSVVAMLLEWLAGENVSVRFPPDAYTTLLGQGIQPSEAHFRDGVERSIQWLRHSGLLLNDGIDGLMEGIATEIYPDGRSRILTEVRSDCIGEASFAFFMHGLLTGDRGSMEMSDRLIGYVFDVFQEKEDPLLKGMIRWSKSQWDITYQDDVARMLYGELLKQLYTGESRRLDDCLDALEFLVRTTGTDGTRKAFTRGHTLNEQTISQLKTSEGKTPSGHYNGYYLASLLLAHKIANRPHFRDTAVAGLETLMRAYPNTTREHSETQELCRLVLPAAWLYEETREARHRDWLYQICADLERFRHEATGAYLEWDTGYKARRGSAPAGEESSLLSRNGDPVTDMLYSLNWLPVGFAQAYFVTKDPYFDGLWNRIVRFLCGCQLHSPRPQLDGGWARAYDVNHREVYGLPKDVGWGPWVIESGWTVAEISAGISMGLLKHRLMTCHGQQNGWPADSEAAAPAADA